MLHPNIVAAWVVGALANVIALPATAQVAVTRAWVRGIVAGQQTTGAFMQLQSATDVSLIGVASPAARSVEVHAMKMDGGMMRMSAVGRLALPAGRIVELKSGGIHVMLMDLTRPIQQGDIVPLALTFEDRAGNKQTVEVNAPVKALTAGGAAER